GAVLHLDDLERRQAAQQPRVALGGFRQRPALERADRDEPVAHYLASPGTGLRSSTRGRSFSVRPSFARSSARRDRRMPERASADASAALSSAATTAASSVRESDRACSTCSSNAW